MNGAGLAVPVHRYSAMRSNAVFGSKRSRRWTEAPARVGAITPSVRPRAWVTGEGMNMTSSGVMPSAATACFGRNELVFQVCRQPLGRASVPELYRMRCGSSANGGSGRRPRSCSVARSSSSEMAPSSGLPRTTIRNSGCGTAPATSAAIAAWSKRRNWPQVTRATAPEFSTMNPTSPAR